MKWSDIVNYFTDWLTKFFMVVFVIAIVFGGIHHFRKLFSKTTSPVEKCRIDSITTVNRNIVVKLDSINNDKNEKIVEIKNLDNDSTLKLFYELIRK